MELGNCEFVSCKNEASSSSGNESENDVFSRSGDTDNVLKGKCSCVKNNGNDDFHDHFIPEEFMHFV
jgi:hypothetical protein